MTDKTNLLKQFDKELSWFEFEHLKQVNDLHIRLKYADMRRFRNLIEMMPLTAAETQALESDNFDTLHKLAGLQIRVRNWRSCLEDYIRVILGRAGRERFLNRIQKCQEDFLESLEKRSGKEIIEKAERVARHNDLIAALEYNLEYLEVIEVDALLTLSDPLESVWTKIAEEKLNISREPDDLLCLLAELADSQKPDAMTSPENENEQYCQEHNIKDLKKDLTLKRIDLLCELWNRVDAEYEKLCQSDSDAEKYADAFLAFCDISDISPSDCVALLSYIEPILKVHREQVLSNADSAAALRTAAQKRLRTLNKLDGANLPDFLKIRLKEVKQRLESAKEIEKGEKENDHNESTQRDGKQN